MKSQDVKVVDGGALAAVDTTTSVHEGIIDQQSIKPKVYKRRFIGMAMLFALNLCSSMAWIDMASVVDFAAKHFSTSTSAINWFSTSFLFVALAANWPASRTTRKSVKLSMIISSAIMIAGTWVMYGGTHTKSFGLSLFGHCIIAVSQPFVLILPALLSEAWFESGSRATATAVSSIANILGSTVGQFIMTAWVKSEEDVTHGILYQSILLTVVGCIVVFVPSKPPTPPELVVAHERTLSQRQELQVLLTRVEFYLVAIPFGMLSGIFNALSFLIFQMCIPYGFTAGQCTIAVCLVIVPGLVTSLIVCRAADIYRCHKWVLKTLTVITGAGFLAFIWVPPSGSIAFLYCISIIISIGVVGSGPIAVEFVAEIIYPLGPELAIAIMWAMGQLFGGVLTIGEGYMTDKNGGLQPGIYLQTALALFCVPFTVSLGLWGRHKYVQLNRTRAEEARQNPNNGGADEAILASKATV